MEILNLRIPLSIVDNSFVWQEFLFEFFYVDPPGQSESPDIWFVMDCCILRRSRPEKLKNCTFANL